MLTCTKNYLRYIIRGRYQMGEKVTYVFVQQRNMRTNWCFLTFLFFLSVKF